jgi:hypothetical protein
MGIVIAAVAAGAVGLAAAFVAIVVLLGQKNGAGRRAERFSASDPAFAGELRQLQAQIDFGRSGYRF